MGKYSEFLNIYEKDVELPSNGEIVKIKPLTTNQIKRLLVHENEKDLVGGERILDDVLKSSIVGKDENFVKSLLIQDRYFLFIQVRILTKGSEHTYPFTCPSCSNQSIQKMDLKNLAIKKMPVLSEENNTISLVNGNIKFTMRNITRQMQEDAYSLINPKLSNSEKQVEMALANMAQAVKCIETPKGVDMSTIQEKMDLIGDLPQQEYEKVKQWFMDNDFGIDLNVITKCPYCSFEEIHTLPLDNFFQ